jgi:hypothetical protein
MEDIGTGQSYALGSAMWAVLQVLEKKDANGKAALRPLLASAPSGKWS